MQQEQIRIKRHTFVTNLLKVDAAGNESYDPELSLNFWTCLKVNKFS